MNLFLTSMYYRMLHDVRLKQAIFFTSVFPILLFVIFSSIWGGTNMGYYYFLLTGIVGATLLSEGLYAIGAIIKDYHDSKLIRFFRVTPVNIPLHFFSIVVSRFIFISITFITLLAIAFIMYGLVLSLQQIAFISLGMIVGLTLFSGLGLVISFINIKAKSTAGLVNLLFFLLLFLSNAYYPLKEINPSLNKIANLLPLNPLLNILRGEELWSSVMYCLIAIAIFTILFRYLFLRYQLTRA